jgi:hypothetical protein
MTKGRQEKLWEWVSSETGATLPIRKVSTLLRAEVRRQVLADPAFAEPDPPIVAVDYGEGQLRTPHRGHPVYQELVHEWNQRVAVEVGTRLKQMAIVRGVVLDASAIDADAVAAVRDTMDLSAYDDRYVYIAFVAIGSEDDWRDLLKAIFERSAPSEAAIASHIATFPTDVQGPGSVPPVA